MAPDWQRVDLGSRQIEIFREISPVDRDLEGTYSGVAVSSTNGLR
jgi:hypothetical protein